MNRIRYYRWDYDSRRWGQAILAAKVTEVLRAAGHDRVVLGKDISRWEKGREPGVLMAQAIAIALDVPLADVFPLNQTPQA